jgi:beta-glucosidase
MKINPARDCVFLIAAVLLPALLEAQPAFIPHPEVWPPAQSAARDPGVEALVEQLLGQMTLEDKIAQMIQADIAWITPADLRTYKLGSILAGGGSAPGGNVRTTPQAWLNLTDEFHREALKKSGSHAPIPVLFGIDAVHGNAKLVGATIFPHNVGLGAANDPDLMRRIGQATAQEVSAVGIDWTFAPTVAVVRDVRWGRSYESYSESPALVAGHAAQMVIGLQGRRGTPEFLSPGHTLSSVKHFVGDGGTSAGRDQGDTMVPESELSGVHAAGFRSAINAGAMIVMASYNSWNGVKSHGNHYLLTDILKERLAFDGFVVGDWNGHEQIPGCTKYRCAAAILAGVDMLMAPDSWKPVLENTLAQARSGEIPPARIDDAVRRILRVKVAAGLFKRPAPQPAATGNFAALGSAAHRALAREAVRKSLVLLKNDHGTLPLNAGGKILVAGAAADSIKDQTGGWTIDWQGDLNSNADFPGATSIYAGIKAAVSAAGGSTELRADGQFSSKPDAAIVVFGESPYAEFEGDRENLEFSPGDKRDLQLLRKLRAAGVPTVAVFLSGRPLWVNPEINASDAFVAAWLPGSEGAGVADVLLRAPGKPGFDFSGRLSFSWPRTAMPVTFDAAGNASGAEFPRGFGLGYQSKPALLGALPEDAAIPPRWLAPQGSLFHAGHATAPWSIFVADETAEVHLTTTRQASPEATVSVELAPESDSATGTWTGGGLGIWRFSGRATDLRAQAQQGTTLELRYRVDQPPEKPVKLGMQCAEPLCGSASGAQRDLTSVFKSAAPGVWQTMSIPLSGLADGGADLKDVVIPLAIETSGRFKLSISEARLAPRNESEKRNPRP